MQAVSRMFAPSRRNNHIAANRHDRHIRVDTPKHSQPTVRLLVHPRVKVRVQTIVQTIKWGRAMAWGGLHIEAIQATSSICPAGYSSIKTCLLRISNRPCEMSPALKSFLRSRSKE